jgi:predicted PurR-regulated permease PerM
MRDMYKKYGALVIFCVLLYFSYLLVKPYILSIISAAIIAYIFYPMHKWFYSKTGKKNITAFLMCVFVLLLVVIPMFYVLTSLILEIPALYSFLSTAFQSAGFLAGLYSTVKTAVGTNINLEGILSSLLTTIVSYIKDLMATLPDKLVNFSISAFFLFFFFRDGEEISEKIKYYLPFNKKDTTILLRELKDTADAVIFGQIVTAFAQAFLATLAYFIVGVNAPLFWGIVTFIFSIIPIFGPYIVYVPLSISMIGISIANHDPFGTFKGGFLLLYGIGIVSTIDNILRPFLISDKVNIHPGFVLVGVIGGLNVFGIIGVVLGPLVIALVVTISNIYDMKEEIEHIEETHRKR